MIFVCGLVSHTPYVKITGLIYHAEKQLMVLRCGNTDDYMTHTDTQFMRKPHSGSGVDITQLINFRLFAPRLDCIGKLH